MEVLCYLHRCYLSYGRCTRAAEWVGEELEGRGGGGVCTKSVQPITVCNFNKLFHEQKPEAARQSRWTQSGCQDERVREILNKQVLRLLLPNEITLREKKGTLR